MKPLPEPKRATQPSFSTDLPDINVWLALATQEHEHHAQALAYWNGTAADRLLFCRVTMLGLVRLLVQPKVMGLGVLNLKGAMKVHQDFLLTSCVGWQEEPKTCAHQLAVLLSAELPSRLLTDAYLAAMAISTQARLVSFDRDFKRFEGLQFLQLPSHGLEHP